MTWPVVAYKNIAYSRQRRASYLDQKLYREHIISVNLTVLVKIGGVSTEDLTMEQESEGVEREEEEGVCQLYNALRTHVGW